MLSIHVSAVTDGEHDDHKHVKVDADDYSDVSDPVSPGPCKVRFQRLPLRTRVIKRRNAFR